MKKIRSACVLGLRLSTTAIIQIFKKMNGTDVPGEINEDLEKLTFLFNLEVNRLASFTDWPFDSGCSCTPEKMAAAGFYHCPSPQEPDAVKCFLCFKELDGWEPDDDPMDEHRKHSPKCAFLALNKTMDDITMGEFLKLEATRQVNRLMKAAEEKIKEFERYASDTRHEMEHLV